MQPVLIGTIGRMQVRVHPLILLVLAGACVLGRLNALLQAMLAMLLHEAAHAAAAKAFGCRMRSIELHPFGGVLRMDARNLSADAECCIAAAGPAMSFIAAGVASITCYLAPRAGARMEAFIAFNLTLASVNLLPALPLDGGRITKCILEEKCNLSFAKQATAWIGVGLGVAMLLLTGVAAHYHVYNLTWPVMGGFLLLASIREVRAAPEKQLAQLWQKEDVIRRGGMDVYLFAAHASMPCTEALRMMRSNRYNCIRVVDEKLELLGELGESALLLGMVAHGSETPIGELLSKT